MTGTNTLAPEYFHDRGFGGKMGFGKKPALIVVDFTVGFTDPALPLGSVSDAEIAQTNRLIDAAHGAGMAVFFTAIQYEDSTLSDAGLWRRKIASLDTLVLGSVAVEQDPRLHMGADDTLIVKRYASSFFGTDLSAQLWQRDIDTLVVAGTSTSGCVRATVVDACQMGFRPIVVREAVCDRSPEAHRQALTDIETKYGDVMGIDEVLSHIAH